MLKSRDPSQDLKFQRVDCFEAGFDPLGWSLRQRDSHLGQTLDQLNCLGAAERLRISHFCAQQAPGSQDEEARPARGEAPGQAARSQGGYSIHSRKFAQKSSICNSKGGPLTYFVDAPSS